MGPDVSVIIPCYNGERWLPFSIRSVLSQAGVRLEIIVVDDGSIPPAEQAVAAVEDARVRYVRTSHAGKGAAVNRGVMESRAEVIAVLDQDDLMAEGRMEKQLRAMSADPGIDAVYSDYRRVRENGALIDVFISRQASNHELLHAMAAKVSLVSMQTMTIRKKVVLRLGGFSEDSRLTGQDDAEFFLRLIASGAKLAYVPGVAASWVSHSGNYSKQAEFQDVRLFFLERLRTLAQEYPVIAGELGHFRSHAYGMRGIYFLERDLPRLAAAEFLKALCARPSDLNMYYLFVKALGMAVLGLSPMNR